MKNYGKHAYMAASFFNRKPPVITDIKVKELIEKITSADTLVRKQDVPADKRGHNKKKDKNPHKTLEAAGYAGGLRL